jgi:hypothetical protein
MNSRLDSRFQAALFISREHHIIPSPITPTTSQRDPAPPLEVSYAYARSEAGMITYQR